MEVASMQTVSEPAQGFGEGPSAAKFQYVGKTAMTVVSPMTGKRYRFTKPGEELEVEAADRSWIAFVPNLIRVS
jgi:hypothetical protein